jgi:hypothetical protein
MVRGTEFRAMLERECGEVSIGCQVATSAQRNQKLAQHPGVAGAGLDYDDRRLSEPGIHQIEGGFGGKWS